MIIRNALGGGSYQIRPIQGYSECGGGGGRSTYTISFYLRNKLLYLPIPGLHECKASYVMDDNRLILMYGA